MIFYCAQRDDQESGTTGKRGNFARPAGSLVGATCRKLAHRKVST
jgi:hypothetical protein